MAAKFGMIVRSMSSTAKVKVPLQLFGLEGRYATALYTAATKLNQLDSVERELTQVQDTLVKSPKLRAVIVSPIINRTVLENTLKEVGSKAGLAAATTNLLVLLAENNRLKKIDGIINAFKQIMSAHRGEVVCEVTTARPLDGSQRKQLEGVLKQFVKSNETIQLKASVDPTIVGGLVVAIGDKYVDMSVATKIKKYTDLISASA